MDERLISKEIPSWQRSIRFKGFKYLRSLWKSETLEQFYKHKFNCVPENLKKDIGHFNVFRVEDVLGHDKEPVRYLGLGVALFVIFAHRSNISRILKGTEPRFGGRKPVEATVAAAAVAADAEEVR